MTTSFPTVDIAPLLADGTPTDQRASIEAIRAACETIGFFAVTGHGIPRTTIDALFTAAYGFFDRPLAEKLLVKRPKPEQNRGYIPYGDETLSRLRGVETPPDAKELFAIGPFDLPDEPYFTGPAAYPSLAANLWPAQPATLQPAMKAYWREIERLAMALCRAFAAALDLPPDFFRQKLDKHISQLRVMHYPPLDRPPLAGQLRAGEHTDLGMMTLLYSDNAVGGLQVRDRDGRWIDAPAAGDAIAVNLGDLMARWTNDRWVSTPHRVINPADGDAWRSRRLSVGLFVIPNYDAEIACIPSCLAPGQTARYAATTVAAYRTQRFARTAGAQPAY
jgi:isopenicillin N synthase-like dioxygenase